jgi:hypothetical protein
MRIAQRGTSFSGLSDDGGQYTLDRWRWSENGTFTGSMTVTQDSSAPAGFNNSLRVVTNTSVSVGTSLAARVEQFIEGFNCADLGWGTANAKTVTLSFWVKSSLTGTFGGAIRNSDDNRSYPFSYTINAADTWEYETITIAGDTSGTWGTTNGTGIRVTLSLGAGTALSGTAGAWSASGAQSATGAVSVVGTTSANWSVTGVQLEVGTQATSFEYRQYGQELALCQRYGYAVNGGYTGYANGTTTLDATINFPVQMRTTPTATTGVLVMGAFGTGGAYNQSSANFSIPSVGLTQTGGVIRFSNFTGLTSSSVYIVLYPSLAATTAYSGFLSAEL